jgi:integration host factor subunit alpha
MPSRKTITRVELSNAVYRTKLGLTRTESSALVDLVLKEIVDTIARCEMVKLSSFGSFTVREKGQRIGRNPKTGVEAPIFPRRAVVFKASAIMKRKIQKDKSDAPSGTPNRTSGLLMPNKFHSGRNAVRPNGPSARRAGTVGSCLVCLGQS